MNHTLLQNKKKIFIIILVIILVLATIVALYREIFPKEIYKVVDRKEAIKKEEKKDNMGITTVGWIKAQGTTIDIPVIHFKDYFYDDIKKEKYAWATSDNKRVYNRTTIYGHNILNLSSNPKINNKKYTSFEDLMSYIYPDFIEKNKYIQYTTGGKTYVYKIFSVRLLKAYNQPKLSTSYNLSKKEFSKYLAEIKRQNLYKTNVKVKDYDGILTLVTCTRFFGPENKNATIIVDARLLHKGEKKKNYTVYKTDNYKKIEKYMKGDESNV